MDQKLREFEIYSDKTISVENVEKAVKNELEGPHEKIITWVRHGTLTGQLRQINGILEQHVSHCHLRLY